MVDLYLSDDVSNIYLLILFCLLSLYFFRGRPVSDGSTLWSKRSTGQQSGGNGAYSRSVSQFCRGVMGCTKSLKNYEKRNKYSNAQERVIEGKSSQSHWDMNSKFSHYI